jgi:serine protease Do
VKLSDISDDVKSKIKVMEVGSSDNLALGEQVVAIGNALGYGQSVTSGIVSALDREVTVETDDGNTVTNNMIQTDASINPGNSGGALLNMKGQLVGINSVKASATGVEGMGYAIPIDTAMPIFSELEAIQSRDIVDEDKRGFMGIKPVDITSEAKQIYNMPSGAFVYEVTNDSAAEKAGLKRGDIITKMDGVIISSAEDLYDRMQYYAAGDEMTVTIERAEGGEYKEQEITLTLDEKPESAKTSSSSQSTQGSNGQNGNGQNDQGGNDQNGGSDNGSDTEQDPFSQIFPEYFRK